MSIRIMIDPGHGGQETGAYAYGVKEKDINLIVSKYLKEILIICGFIVGMTRTNDKKISLYDRSYLGKKFKCSLLISVHHNAYKKQDRNIGCEVIHSIFDDFGKKISETIVEEFIAIGMKKHRGAFSRKSKNGNWDYYSIVRNSYKMGFTGIITEFGFMDSNDRFLFDTDEKLYREAEAIAKAVCRNYDVNFEKIIEQRNDSEDNIATEYNEEENDKNESSLKDNVLELQKKLNSLGYTDKDGEKLIEDDILGPNTKFAVMEFQKDVGILVDGIVGPITRNKLDEKIKLLEEENKNKQNIIDGQKGIITANILNVRQGPGIQYRVIGSLFKGNIVTLHKKVDKWYSIYFGNSGGYVYENYLDET